MNVSENGINLIKEFEGGPYLSAYKDPIGIWTIGWGHTAGVYGGMTITAEQANQFLKEDLETYVTHVNRYSDTYYHFNQNQFDAMVSFAFNLGSIGQLTDYGRRSISTISEKILLYTKAGGQELPGLVRRRQAEKALFDKPVDSKEKVGWVKTGKGWKYYENGKPIKGQWKTIDGKDYYFWESGNMAYSEYIKSADYNTNKKLYYVGKDGAWDGHEYKWFLDVKGWWLAGVGTGWYAKNEWAQVDKKWYYFDEKGYMLCNESRLIDGTLCKFSASGALME